MTRKEAKAAVKATFGERAATYRSRRRGKITCYVLIYEAKDDDGDYYRREPVGWGETWETAIADARRLGDLFREYNAGHGQQDSQVDQ